MLKWPSWGKAKRNPESDHLTREEMNEGLLTLVKMRRDIDALRADFEEFKNADDPSLLEKWGDEVQDRITLS